jgi:hypothetical protein
MARNCIFIKYSNEFFNENPLMQQEDIDKKNRQREKSQAMMEKLKRSKLRRRQAKEQAKQQQQEVEIPLEPEIEQKVEGGLRMPMLHKPSDKNEELNKVSDY